MAAEYQLYSSPASYYSAKGRCYLQWKRVPHVDNLADVKAYATVIHPRTGAMFVPVVITPDDVTLQDTCDIIDAMEARHPERPVLPADPVLRFASLLMEYYADECLIYPGLHMRWHYEENAAWAVPEFQRAAAGFEDYPSDGARAMASGIAKYVWALGLEDEAVKAATRKVFDRVMDRFEAHLVRTPFLLGGSPTLGDVALMGPIYGHWYRDIYPAGILRRQYPRVCVWAERMNMSNALAEASDHHLAPTALELFKEIGLGFGAFAVDVARGIDEYFATLKDGETPGRIAPNGVATRLFDTPLHIHHLNVYWAYKQQRVRDAYRAVPGSARVAVDALLDQIGFGGLPRGSVPWRLAKGDRFQLVLHKAGDARGGG
jgi:glutathione S-transferase